MILYLVTHEKLWEAGSIDLPRGWWGVKRIACRVVLERRGFLDDGWFAQQCGVTVDGVDDSVCGGRE